MPFLEKKLLFFSFGGINQNFAIKSLMGFMVAFDCPLDATNSLNHLGTLIKYIKLLKFIISLIYINF